MDKSKQSWQDFVKRRRLNVVEWIKSKGLTTAEKLKKWCESNNMDTPSESEEQKLFGNVQKPVKASIEKEAEPAPELKHDADMPEDCTACKLCRDAGHPGAVDGFCKECGALTEISEPEKPKRGRKKKENIVPDEE